MALILRAKEIPPDLAEYFEPIDIDALRNVFVVNPHPFKQSHFSTFPPKLVEPCIKAGTSEHGCCPECGKGWERIVEKSNQEAQRVGGPKTNELSPRADGTGSGGYYPKTHSLGWRPGCSHGHAPIPCMVLDCFSGAGTTVMVALRLGRRAIGIDLSEDYVRLSIERIAKDNPLFNVSHWPNGTVSPQDHDKADRVPEDSTMRLPLVEKRNHDGE